MVEETTREKFSVLSLLEDWVIFPLASRHLIGEAWRAYYESIKPLATTRNETILGMRAETPPHILTQIAYGIVHYCENVDALAALVYGTPWAKDKYIPDDLRLITSNRSGTLEFDQSIPTNWENTKIESQMAAIGVYALVDKIAKDLYGETVPAHLSECLDSMTIEILKIHEESLRLYVNFQDENGILQSKNIEHLQQEANKNVSNLLERAINTSNEENPVVLKPDAQTPGFFDHPNLTIWGVNHLDQALKSIAPQLANYIYITYEYVEPEFVEKGVIEQRLIEVNGKEVRVTMRWESGVDGSGESTVILKCWKSPSNESLLQKNIAKLFDNFPGEDPK